ncbi:MAG: cupin domain-containing protein [Gemmatimonadales bacterium]
MSDRPAELIAQLCLIPHVEGGYYVELHRSNAVVHPADGRGARSALTSIYFLLPAGSVSRWHRVQSDEIWHFYEGAPLDLWVASPDGGRLDRHQLGPLESNRRPAWTVPAGCWQAARTTGAYTLVGCAVGPGFDFRDFVFAADCAGVAEVLRNKDAGAASLL